jgi:GyrI-like small molecule binding domain
MYDVSTAHETGRHLAVSRFDATPEEMGQQQGAAFGRVASYLARIKVPVTGPAVSCYEMGEKVFHVASGFVVSAPFDGGDGVEPFPLPACEVATTTHIGPYDQLGHAYDALQEWARAHGRKVDESGLMWEEYWTGPETPPEQTRTAVFWPLVPEQG